MLVFPVSLAALLLAAQASAQGTLQINTPGGTYACQSSRSSYTCPSPPCTVVARPTGDVASSLHSFPSVTDTSGSVGWTPVGQAEGVSFTMCITDSLGNTISSAPVVVAAGDNKCLDGATDSSSSAAAASATATDKAASVAAAATSKVSSAVSAASSLASSIPSASGALVRATSAASSVASGAKSVASNASSAASSARASATGATGTSAANAVAVEVGATAAAFLLAYVALL